MVIIPAWLNNGLGKFLLVVLIGVITVILERIVRRLVDKSFKKSSKFIKVDPTQYAILKHFLSALIYLIGIGSAIYAIPQLRAISISLFAGAGVLAVIVGFASQQAFSNIVSGIFIAIFKPFRVGDRIKIGNEVSGIVEDITLRHTVIKNFENKRLIIPNTKISEQTIENASVGDEKICKFVEFGISYDSDINTAMNIMKQETEKHPKILDNRTDEERKNKEPKVVVRVIGFSDSSVNIRAWAWARNPSDAFVMGCDLNKSIKERFDKEGIEIPFPYRTIVYKKDLIKKK
ncbi:MAG: mechanosensitive ion channel family protein [Nanoarchaeota archaeon]